MCWRIQYLVCVCKRNREREREIWWWGSEGGSVDERGKENMRYEAQFASVCNCLVPTYLPTYLPYYNDQDGQIKRKKKTFLLNLSIVSTTANLIGFTA